MRKIQDAGDVLEGARKHLWKTFNKIQNVDLQFITDFKKSDVFPKFDIDKMLEDGASEALLTVIVVSAAIVPRKPRNTRRNRLAVERFNKHFANMIGFIQSLFKLEDISADAIVEASRLGFTFSGYGDKM